MVTQISQLRGLYFGLKVYRRLLYYKFISNIISPLVSTSTVPIASRLNQVVYIFV